MGKVDELLDEARPRGKKAPWIILAVALGPATISSIAGYLKARSESAKDSEAVLLLLKTNLGHVAENQRYMREEILRLRDLHELAIAAPAEPAAVSTPARRRRLRSTAGSAPKPPPPPRPKTPELKDMSVMDNLPDTIGGARKAAQKVRDSKGLAPGG